MGSNLAQDFIFGVDPFGIYTSQYGQQAEQAGLSEAQHSLKKGVTMAGGLVGGTVVTPGVLMGVARAAQAAGQTKGDYRKRLAAAGVGFLKGLKEPAQAASDIIRVRGAMSRAGRQGRTRLTEAEKGSLKRLSGEVRLKDVAKSFVSSPFKSVTTLPALKAGVLTRSGAKALKQPIGKASLILGIPIVGGGLIGGLGAGIQYSKGRQTERRFRRRADYIRSQPQMYKMSSVERAAIQASYFAELDKIARSKSIPFRLGKMVRGFVDAKDKATGFPGRLYREYAQGFYDKGVSDHMSELAKELKGINYGALAIPTLVGVGGALGGVALGKAMSGQ